MVTIPNRVPTPAEIARRTPLGHDAPIQPSKAVAPLKETPAVDQYLDAVGGPEGRFCKFNKGEFVRTDNGEPMDTDADYRVLFRETRVSWKKFAEGQPPEVHGGLLFGGYVLPRRETLGNTDESLWPLGLSGFAQDPWQHFLELVLQRTDTQEVFLFGTSSVTGRRAVAALLKHCQRAGRNDPAYVPVVKLRTGSFKHKDPRVGTVNVPNFVVVGQAKAAAVPNVANDMDDEIPF
jgi:hypothetical protein